jgi:DNA/RNA-binding domain of Phe-tRNA-synthetase-like protein
MPEVCHFYRMEIVPCLKYDSAMAPRNANAAIVWGFNMPDCPKTISMPASLSVLIQTVQAKGEEFFPAERKAAVRAMLRFGHFKPSGRSKPSSEYLLSAAIQNEFPLVNGPVDANNAISLRWGYPASIFDLELCGTELLVRRGAPGESYVFNNAGQIIDLHDLLCVCRKENDAWMPCGNPVKDSMATKIRETTRHAAAVIYAPVGNEGKDLEAAADAFASLLKSECGAHTVGWQAV